MYLRRVEAYGFKAFADRQVFEFGPGLTAVVGPNGSGKSNVSDAIRWALGEQSARSIRARKTGDVIFSGSDGRREMGVAEVTLYLDNSEQWMPIDFEEVSVRPPRLPQRRERVPHQRPEGAAAGRAGSVPARPGRPELLRNDVPGPSSTRCSACDRSSGAT